VQIYKSEINKLIKYIMTLDTLKMAIVSDNLAAIQKIVSKGSVDLNGVDEKGYSILSYAIVSRSEEVIRFLVESGADINITQNNGLSIIGIAVLRSGDHIVKLLLDLGADPNTPMTDGYNALHIAAISGTCIQLLVNANTNINAESENGLTPLYIALIKENIYSIISLIEEGADLITDVHENSGYREYLNTLYSQNVRIVKSLIRDGEPSDEDLRLYPALHCFLLIKTAEQEKKLKQKALAEIETLRECIEEMKLAPPSEGGEYFREARRSFMDSVLNR